MAGQLCHFMTLYTVPGPPACRGLAATRTREVAEGTGVELGGSGLPEGGHLSPSPRGHARVWLCVFDLLTVFPKRSRKFYLCGECSFLESPYHGVWHVVGTQQIPPEGSRRALFGLRILLVAVDCAFAWLIAWEHGAFATTGSDSWSVRGPSVPPALWVHPQPATRFSPLASVPSPSPSLQSDSHIPSRMFR